MDPTQKTISQPQSSFSLLPDEITENILARVSRWYYPSLSLVSKQFRSLVSSMQIYKTRSQIGSQETCFYVCLQLDDHPYSSWFSLWAKPNKTLAKEIGNIIIEKDDPSGNSVVPTPFSSSHSLPITNQNTVTVGSEIYIIGGYYQKPSSFVRILDCRTHTWRNGPNMTVARENVYALFVDEKIVVMGGCDINKYSAYWLELFDMKTQSWTALPGPGADDELGKFLHDDYDQNIVDVFDGKLYVAVDDTEYVYEIGKILHDGTWKLVRQQSSFLFNLLVDWCEIENVIYCCTYFGELMWLDSKTKVREWREIKGLGKLREHPTRGLRDGNEFVIENFGGKLLVMWGVSDDNKPTNKIWYAKISLESRCNGGEVWGTVECADVLTFPGDSYDSFICLTASV
ncbi:unnamed protein product [Microthlaspi erraticum]|uniref:F-box domain-containing protein n=1 Tax=Microthlaspi erraticum TaxID=1685480 RepID=A0A6D2J8E6_9BRAS|nr:unnamed protein product [Microthlaspi erraticum]